MARSSPDLDMVLELDRTSRSPLTVQLADALRGAIGGGRVLPGARLPPTRVLARTLGVTRHVVVTAFEMLFAEGWLEGQPGSGTFVRVQEKPLTSVPPEMPRWAKVTQELAGEPPVLRLDLRLGAVSVQPLPASVWRRAWRFAGTALPPSDAGPVGGLPELRVAVAAYLARTRGLSAPPEAIIVTSGANAGLRLLTQLTLSSGDTAVVEEPGYPLMGHLIERRGATVLPVPVDHDGLRVDILPDGAVLAHVTPSHQYPAGSRLSVPRRHALLAWARSNDTLLVENDYDGEFRYGVAPLPALASLDAQRVAYVGTFSKVLSPALRVGFVVLPPALRPAAYAALEREGERVTWPLQRALTFLLEEGHLDRHLRRVRREYARKRTALIAALTGTRGDMTLQGLEGGTHVLLEDPTGHLEALGQTLRRDGVEVQGLREFFRGEPTRLGLLVGFGALNDAALVQTGDLFTR